MHRDPLRKLIQMKEADEAALSKEAAHIAARLQDAERQIAELRVALVDRTSRRDRVLEEVSLLKQALGDEGATEATPDVGNNSLEVDGDYIEIEEMPGVAPIRLYLRDIDFTDGEPKVRQHTVEVRKRVLKLIAKHGPLSSVDIAEALTGEGFSIAPDNVIANLSAILSRTSFFVSQARRWHLVTGKLLSARRSK